MFLSVCDMLCWEQIMEISISIEQYLVDKKEKLTQYIVEIVKLKEKMAEAGKKVSLHFDYFKSNPEVFALVQSFSGQIDIDLHLMQAPVPSVVGFRSVSFDARDLKNKTPGDIDMVNAGQRGLVLDLGEEIRGYEDFIRDTQYFIVMTVQCGKSGQVFQASALSLIEQIRQLNPRATIILDGGINETTINLVKKAGVDVAVVGSYAKKAYENGDFEISVNRLLRD